MYFVFKGFHQNDDAGVSVNLIGQPWLHVDTGAAITLTCEVSGKNQFEFENRKYKDFVLWRLDDVPVMVLFTDEEVSQFP